MASSGPICERRCRKPGGRWSKESKPSPTVRFIMDLLGKATVHEATIILALDDLDVPRYFPDGNNVAPARLNTIWPVMFVAAAYTRKHILLPRSKPNFHCISSALRQFAAKVRWSWSLKDGGFQPRIIPQFHLCHLSPLKWKDGYLICAEQ